MCYTAILILVFATAALSQTAPPTTLLPDTNQPVSPSAVPTNAIPQSAIPQSGNWSTVKSGTNNEPVTTTAMSQTTISTGTTTTASPAAAVPWWQIGSQKGYMPEKPRNVLALPWCKNKNCDFVAGRWTDTTLSMSDIWLSNKNEHLLINEDYEVVKTDEICATVRGLFYSQDNSVRYITYFHGARTSAEFIFTTRGSAESLAQRYCTPESLTSMINGTATTKREY